VLTKQGTQTHTHTHTHTHTCSNPTLTHRCQSNYTMLYLYNKPACSGNIHNTWQKVKTWSNDSVTQVLHEVRQVILFIVLLFLPQIWQCFQHGLHCESTWCHRLVLGRFLTFFFLIIQREQVQELKTDTGHQNRNRPKRQLIQYVNINALEVELIWNTLT